MHAYPKVEIHHTAKDGWTVWVDGQQIQRVRTVSVDIEGGVATVTLELKAEFSLVGEANVMVHRETTLVAASGGDQNITVTSGGIQTQNIAPGGSSVDSEAYLYTTAVRQGSTSSSVPDGYPQRKPGTSVANHGYDGVPKPPPHTTEHLAHPSFHSGSELDQ